MDLEKVWEHREEVIYPALFGKPARGIMPMQQEVFNAFGEVKVDPNWLKHGVMEFGPTDTRKTWVYVTSGYSNPWDTAPADYDPNGESGAGVEFLMVTEKPGDWAAMRLQSVLAMDMLLSSGQLGDGDPLAFYDRLPGQFAVNGSDRSLLSVLMLCPPDPDAGLPEGFDLPSGKAMFVAVTAITEAERAYADQFGHEPLVDKLRGVGAWPLIQPDRPSVA